MFSAWSFTRRYTLALGIIALLSALAYYNLNHMIESQENDGRMINISGRQRMLSQKIALYAIYYKTKNLYENIRLMEKSHDLLVHSPMNEALKKIYFESPVNLDQRVREYLFHAKRFYENHDGRSLNYVLKHSQPLLYDLDKAVSIYQKVSETKTQRLKKVEFYIFVLTLVTLFFEALFIFMPANRSINRKTWELMAEKEYSDMIIESSANAIIAIDKERKVQTYNRMAEKIFGYTKAEMIGKDSLKKIISGKYYSDHEKGLDAFLKSGTLKYSGEMLESEARDKSGRTFPIRIYFGKTSDKENVSVVASIQDISKEKLRDTIVQQQAKFAALGEMIAIIAHQWRQPLAQLNFNCMYIRKKLTDEELKKEINKNEEIISFMSETITSFEDFYRESENEWFPPEKSIRQALRLIESLIKLNQIELTEKIMTDEKIYGRPNTLAQVVLSILQNMVDIIRQRRIEHPKIGIHLEKRDSHTVKLTIRDNAGGIAAEPIEEIFEPFKSRKSRPSTGIGLYMARLIVEEKFGGTIAAFNTEEGATFVIELPVVGQSMV